METHRALPRRCRARGLAAVATVVVALLAPGHGRAAEKRHVLVLHSYHKGLTWTDHEDEGITSVLSPRALDLEIHVEYMDAKRVAAAGYADELRALLERKYAGVPLRVIVSTDDDAYEFLLARGPALFPGVPVVFCGVNDFSPSDLEGRRDLFTGVVEAFDVTGTLRLALALHPETTRFVIINDRTTTGLANRRMLERAVAELRRRVSFTFLEDLTMDEVRERVAALSPGHVVLLMTFNKDRAGEIFDYDRSIELIASAARVPIYGVWDFYLGHGIVGGLLTSGHLQGRRAAEMALRILDGEPVRDVPVVTESPNTYMFDDRELRRFGIDDDELPRSSVVVGKAASFYAQHREKVWGTAAIVLTLSALLVGLLVNVLRRRRTEASLRQSEERLNRIVETLLEGIALVDRDGRIVFANPALRRIFGAAPDEMVGVRGDDPRWRLRRADGAGSAAEGGLPLGAVLRDGQPRLGVEYVARGAGGAERTVKVNAAPLQDGSGGVGGMVASLEDVTDRKEMERRLEHLSLHDAMTGLYNRTFFEEELVRLGESRSPVGFIVCDIDGLKLVNDTLGHDRGDALVRLTANTLRSCFRKDAVLARIGGDEFAILVPNASRAVVEAACRRLHAAVERHNARARPTLPFSLSVGFVVSAGDRPATAELFREADDNMHREKLHHRQSQRGAVVQALWKALEVRELEPEGHAARMQELLADFARALGFDDGRVNVVRLFARFHDVGKLGLPDRVLFKPTPLTYDEALELRSHCEVGERIARAAPDLLPIAGWILRHHERWDGGGYPLGLAGTDIPLECRMLAIADAYDAMTSDGPHRKAMTHELAVSELRRCAGSQLDPELVSKFLEVLDRRKGDAGARAAS
jgi:diguanylate cyclase (GGDEF)-like protein